MLREIEDKAQAQDPIENLELMSNFLSSSMPDKLKQFLLVFVYESDFIIPKDSRLKLLSEHAKYIPETAKGEKILLREIEDKAQAQDPIENLELMSNFFSSSMPYELKKFLMVFVYENDFIIPKNSRVSLLSRYVEYIPLTTKGEGFLLKELRDKNQNPLEKLELVNKVFSSSMPDKLKQSLLVFVYENDFIIPKDSRLKLLSEHVKYIPETVKGEKILLREIEDKTQTQDPIKNLELMSNFFSSSMPDKLKESLLVFVYENDFIIPKNLRLKFLFRHTKYIPATAKGETLLLTEIMTRKESLNKTTPNRAYMELMNYFFVVAARRGFHKVVKILLGVEGIDINYSLYSDGSALKWASLLGHTEVVKLLKEAGAR